MGVFLERFNEIYTVLDKAKRDIRDITGVDVNLHMIKEGAKVLTPREHLRVIIEVVSKECGIPLELIKSKQRDSEISIARHIICHLAKEHFELKLTLVKIGDEIGGRGHSTVLHSVRACQDLLDTNKKFKKTYETIASLCHAAVIELMDVKE